MWDTVPLTHWQGGSVNRWGDEPQMASAAFLGYLPELQVTWTKGKEGHLLWPL